MLFSVLIPVFNVEKYLDKCLDSVVNQKYNDYEIVIVDDGSTDDSSKICDDYQKRYPRIVKIFHKDNKGLISARRVGIKNASGDYCVFVDSDDYVSEDLLISLSEYIYQYKVDIVLYSYTYFDEDSIGQEKKPIAENGRIWSGDGKKELYEALATTSSIDAMFIKAIKTELLQEDPIDYTLYYHKNMSEDTLQSIYPMTAAGTIGYLDKSLYYYRYNPNSISRNFSVGKIKDKNTNHVYQVIMEYLPKWGLANNSMIQKVNARWFNEAMYYFCKCYENAKSRLQRKSVLSFDWNSMLASTDVDSYSEYVGRNYLKIYCWYKNKDYSKIKLYFIINRIYKVYKTKKQKTMNN